MSRWFRRYKHYRTWGSSVFESALWAWRSTRYQREERIEAHAKFHLAQIHLEAEAARKQINEQKCFAARSIGQIRRRKKGLAQNGK